MGTKERAKIPKVFVSYSHDSPKHKAWVEELATKLVESGIDVILDRWELKPGGDIPKFMEKGLTTADRVLMICSDAYVQKADEGKGGVGYEAMIVTAEMVQDLGTTKFIPIIRQGPRQALLPKSMGLRLYVNLSEDQEMSERFEELLRELHNEPAFRKPPIGKNPFANAQSGVEVHANTPSAVRIDISVDESDPRATYARALEIARQGDLLEWRRLVKQVKKPIPSRLNEWRSTYEEKRLNREDFPEMCRTGMAVYAPLMSMTLAGVESGIEKFNNQTAVLDEILFPKNWNASGLTLLVNFPDMVAFTYQAQHGAVCLETGQITLSTDLASTNIEHREQQEPLRLFQNRYLIGWPDPLEHNCTKAWRFLVELSEHQLWMLDIFGSQEDYHVALCAYYLTLNTMELAFLLQQAGSDLPELKDYSLKVPLVCHSLPRDIQQRAYRLLLQRPEEVLKIWRKLGVSDESMAKAWPRWMQEGETWLTEVYKFGFHGRLAHEGLINDLNAA